MLTRIYSQLFWVLLMRCFRLPLLPSASAGVPPHRRIWPAPRSLRTGREEWTLCGERCCAYVQKGWRQSVMVRDMHVGMFDIRDGRRLEVVADGLPLFGRAQLAVDTTLVYPLHCDDTAHRGAAHHSVRRRKERTYLELVAPRAQARFGRFWQAGGGLKKPRRS